MICLIDLGVNRLGNEFQTFGKGSSTRQNTTPTRVDLTSTKRDFAPTGKMLNCYGLPRVSRYVYFLLLYIRRGEGRRRVQDFLKQ